METQIYEGDLFDLDMEVEPILEVLVGKTLEQSMMEVMEEEELANMRAHQEHFEEIRNAELAETQRLEEAEKRRMHEKERRVAQEKERVAREAQVTEKVAARTFTKGFLSELQSSVVPTSPTRVSFTTRSGGDQQRLLAFAHGLDVRAPGHAGGACDRGRPDRRRGHAQAAMLEEAAAPVKVADERAATAAAEAQAKADAIAAADAKAAEIAAAKAAAEAEAAAGEEVTPVEE